MIPLQLSFQGLYSYREPQTINFEQLTASQLFGIFGPVGSGKSSVLEAIMFVLYDRSDRLNKTNDNRYYNMLNLQSDLLSIDFVFQTQAQLRYRFTVSAKRKKKDFEKVEIKERLQYAWENEGWVPIEVADASSLIGMTYDNFMQTVIIPQGKFREFIDRKPYERTQMLKELFRLEKFDLSSQTGQLLSRTRTDITETEGRLAEVNSVSEEELQARQQEVENLKADLEQNKQLYAKVSEQCQQYEQLKKLLDDLSTAQQHRSDLLEHRDAFQAQENQLNEYREAETYFIEKINLLENIVTDLGQTETTLGLLQNQVAAEEKNLAEAQQILNAVQQTYAQRDTMREQCQDLEHLIKLHQLGQQQRQVAQQLEVQQQQESAATEQLALAKQQLQKQEAQLAALDQQLLQQSVIQEVFQWHQRQQEMAQEHRECSTNVAQSQASLLSLENNKKKLLTEYEWTENGSFSHFFEVMERRKGEAKVQQEILLQQTSALKVKEELSNYAQQLVTGNPCPLCGAKEHPAGVHIDSVAQEQQAVQQLLEEIKQQEKDYATLEKAMHQLESDHRSLRTQQQTWQAHLQSLQTKQQDHQRHFRWDDFHQIDFSEVEKTRERLSQALRQKEPLQRAVQQHRQQQEQLEQQRAQVQQQRHEAERTAAGYEASARNYRSMLKHLPESLITKRTEAELRTSLTTGEERLQAVEQQYEQAQQVVQRLEKTLGQFIAKAEATAEIAKKLERQRDKLLSDIEILCSEKDFESVSYIQSLLDLKLDKEAVQEKILTYKNQLHSAEQQVKKLHAAAEGQTYDALAHQQASATCAEVQHAIELTQQAYTLGLRDIADMEQNRRKAQQLHKSLAALQVRESNLKEINSLFRGNGFVNYASTVLLQDVCRAANVRYKRLTNNHLSLELSENNEFIVRDHLNDGKTRLLKTLSGGQTFQAALCLALALAENVKSLNQSEQSFFFLDEGFGSLDKESLRVVFDTLKSLRQDNRVVGIISHVEELQQEIDVYLRIEQDKERGSLIRSSWE